MIGKEIIRFHAVYWPAFLMAAELPLPKQIFAHGWLLFEQEKMSKSKGNVAYPEPIVKVLRRTTRCGITCCAKSSSGRTAIFRARH